MHTIKMDKKVQDVCHFNNKDIRCIIIVQDQDGQNNNKDIRVNFVSYSFRD